MKRATIFLLLLAIVVAAAFYYWWSKPAAPAPAAPPDLITLFPPDATFILYADAAALRASPFVRELLRQLPAATEDGDYKEFVAATGFDYTRDLARLAVAVLPHEEGGNAIAFADGRFDHGRIASYALKSGKLVKRDGRDVYEFTTGNLPTSAKSNSSSPKTMQLVFLSDTRVGLFEGAQTFHALSSSASHSSPGDRPGENGSALGQRVTRVAASEAFAIVHVDKAPSSAILEGWASKEIAETLQGVKWVTLAARPAGNDMNVVLEAECDSPTNARKLSWGLEGLRILARMSLSDPKSRQGLDPGLAALLEVIAKDGKITSSDRYVRLSFALTQQFLAAMNALPPHTSAPPPAEKANGRGSPSKR